MTYRVFSCDGYIISIFKDRAGNISDVEYARIRAVLDERPVAPDGYDYRLREDMTWELYQLPVPVDDVEETV